VVARIRAAGGEATAVATDVRDAASVEQMVTHAVERFGRLDVLCNNAGVGLIATLVDTSAADYDHVMDVNARGVFLGMKYGIPPMLECGGGSVINMASAASFVGFERDAAYCASKGAVLMLTRQAALDYARAGVRVNAVAPGFVDTPMLDGYCAAQPDPSAARADVVEAHPMGRLGSPDDIAGAALFLASDDSRWMTGASLAVDGGMTCQ
jgi:NAD(P)-dependent dehydrogenase (short-subunit alcohol dehydrogenase family)